MYVDSYPSASVTRILFLLRSLEDRARLLKIFGDLSNRGITQFALRDVEWVEFSANCPSIVLKLVDRESSGQIQVESTSTGQVFAWSRHPEGWLECAEKIERLVHPGHQYLGSGVAEIEVSFLENVQRR